MNLVFFVHHSRAEPTEIVERLVFGAGNRAQDERIVRAEILALDGECEGRARTIHPCANVELTDFVRYGITVGS